MESFKDDGTWTTRWRKEQLKTLPKHRIRGDKDFIECTCGYIAKDMNDWSTHATSFRDSSTSPVSAQPQTSADRPSEVASVQAPESHASGPTTPSKGS